MRFSIRAGSTSTQRMAALAMVPASGCAPPPPPTPAGGPKQPAGRPRAAQAAKPGSEHETAGEIAPEMALRNAHEDLVGALNDALRADVLPVARGETAPADEILALQLVERLGLRPLADDVAIRHQDDRRLGVRPDHADRLARLHQQRLAVLHAIERRDNAVMGGPVARSAPERGIDDEVVRALGHREHALQK